MNVSAIIVTRGDVDVMPCFDTIPEHWQKLVWINGDRLESWGPLGYMQDAGVLELGGGGAVFPDLSVYGRYAAIQHTTADLIYVQDDDVIVSDPQAIVDGWLVSAPLRMNHLVANMPPEFRHDGYTDSCLVGFGACFHRDAWNIALGRFASHYGIKDVMAAYEQNPGFLLRTADVLLTTLTPFTLVDVPKTNLPWAEDENRMYRTSGHVEERQRMLELARQVRDS